MKIKINDEYQIVGDATCWTTQQYKGKNKKGEDNWTNLGYYMDFTSALNALTEYQVRIANVESFEEIRKTMLSIRAQVNEVAKTFKGLEVERIQCTVQNVTPSLSPSSTKTSEKKRSSNVPYVTGTERKIRGNSDKSCVTSAEKDLQKALPQLGQDGAGEMIEININ